MIALVTGGSGSGKSAWAEGLACRLAQGPKYYLATMQPEGGEARARIARHRALRAGKGFCTLECPLTLPAGRFGVGDTVLLECLSNWAANRMFAPGSPAPGECLEAMWGELEGLMARCGHLVVVSNEIFSDGIRYDEGTMAYLGLLGGLNRRLAQRADGAVEVVCGIPVPLKGTLPFPA